MMIFLSLLFFWVGQSAMAEVPACAEQEQSLGDAIQNAELFVAGEKRERVQIYFKKIEGRPNTPREGLIRIVEEDGKQFVEFIDEKRSRLPSTIVPLAGGRYPLDQVHQWINVADREFKFLQEEANRSRIRLTLKSDPTRSIETGYAVEERLESGGKKRFFVVNGSRIPFEEVQAYKILIDAGSAGAPIHEPKVVPTSPNVEDIAFSRATTYRTVKGKGDRAIAIDAPFSPPTDVATAVLKTRSERDRAVENGILKLYETGVQEAAQEALRKKEKRPVLLEETDHEIRRLSALRASDERARDVPVAVLERISEKQGAVGAAKIKLRNGDEIDLPRVEYEMPVEPRLLKKEFNRIKNELLNEKKFGDSQFEKYQNAGMSETEARLRTDMDVENALSSRFDDFYQEQLRKHPEIGKNLGDYVGRGGGSIVFKSGDRPGVTLAATKPYHIDGSELKLLSPEEVAKNEQWGIARRKALERRRAQVERSAPRSKRPKWRLARSLAVSGDIEKYGVAAREYDPSEVLKGKLKATLAQKRRGDPLTPEENLAIAFARDISGGDAEDVFDAFYHRYGQRYIVNTSNGRRYIMFITDANFYSNMTVNGVVYDP